MSLKWSAHFWEMAMGKAKVIEIKTLSSSGTYSVNTELRKWAFGDWDRDGMWADGPVQRVGVQTISCKMAA